MPMFNLLECMWNHFRDEVNDSSNENNENNDASNFSINNNKTISSTSFECKTKLIGSTPNNCSRLDVVVPLKYFSNFWRSLDLPLTNCIIELDLSWSRYCVISQMSRTSRAIPNTYPARYEVVITTNSATFKINNAKLLCSSCYFVFRKYKARI